MKNPQNTLYEITRPAQLGRYHMASSPIIPSNRKLNTKTRAKGLGKLVLILFGLGINIVFFLIESTKKQPLTKENY